MFGRGTTSSNQPERALSAQTTPGRGRGKRPPTAPSSGRATSQRSASPPRTHDEAGPSSSKAENVTNRIPDPDKERMDNMAHARNFLHHSFGGSTSEDATDSRPRPVLCSITPAIVQSMEIFQDLKMADPAIETTLLAEEVPLCIGQLIMLVNELRNFTLPPPYTPQITKREYDEYRQFVQQLHLPTLFLDLFDGLGHAIIDGHVYYTQFVLPDLNGELESDPVTGQLNTSQAAIQMDYSLLANVIRVKTTQNQAAFQDYTALTRALRSRRLTTLYAASNAAQQKVIEQYPTLPNITPPSGKMRGMLVTYEDNANSPYAHRIRLDKRRMTHVFNALSSTRIKKDTTVGYVRLEPERGTLPSFLVYARIAQDGVPSFEHTIRYYTMVTEGANSFFKLALTSGIKTPYVLTSDWQPFINYADLVRRAYPPELRGSLDVDQPPELHLATLPNYRDTIGGFYRSGISTSL